MASHNRYEKYALLSNPLIGSKLLENLFERKEPFDSISDDVWQKLIEYAGDNKLIRVPYDSHYLDGFTDYSYSCMLRAAWKLADTVPVTKDWAYTLWRLLFKAYPYHDIKPLNTINRWSVLGNDSVDIRMILAKALPCKDFEKLKDSDALLRRKAYYEKFYCYDEKILDKFFEHDKFEFVESAINNDNLYRKEIIREKLESLAEKTNNADLMYYNWFLSKLEECRKNHPDWFEDDTQSEEVSDNSDLDDVAEIEAQKIRKLHQIHNLVFYTFIIVLSIALYLWIR